MPIELRKLVFTGEELMPVILDYCRDSQIHVPSTKVKSIDVSSKLPLTITLTFPGSGENDDFTIELERNRLLAAFIRACKVLKIPLPRNEDKHLKVDEKGIALVFGSQTSIYR